MEKKHSSNIELSAGDEKYDPLEDTPEYLAIQEELDKEIQAKIKEDGFPDRVFHGYCHVYWERKKKILKEKYNMEWKSPAELNPYIIFD